MKTSLLIAISLLPGIVLATDPLPKRPDFNHYQGLSSHSPFAIATVVPTAMPNFAPDLYVGSVTCPEDGCVVTLASATDKNFKEYVSTKGPNDHGLFIRDIQWSDPK